MTVYLLSSYLFITSGSWGTRYRSLLRHSARSRKFAASIPIEVTGFFNWPNPSSHTMAVGSTQPLTEMSTRNLLGGKGRPVHKAWQPFRHLWADCLENVGASTSHNPMGLHGLLQEYFYPFLP
jgi:hypothetical protein